MFGFKRRIGERDEYKELWEYQKRQTDTWRGIAAAMGYEGRAHDNVKPKTDWLLARVARFRRQAAMEEITAMVVEKAASRIEAGTAETGNTGSARRAETAQTGSVEDESAAIAQKERP